MRNVLPVLSVLAVILGVWVLAVVPMNIHQAVDQAQRDGVAVTPDTPAARQDVGSIALALRNPGVIADTYAMTRFRLPGPQQVAGELVQSVFGEKVTSKRSLVYHAWVTLAPTLLGFAIGTVLGIALAVGIVFSRTMDLSVLPWIIVSQTIPILALAPMIIVVLGAAGFSGVFPKAVISAYLSFFPVVVGMVKGLRSPDASQLDLLRTYHASGVQGFWKLRLPASVPYLFASLKIGIAAALVGTIVAELPTGAQAGFGGRLLVGDQYGRPIITWAALFGAGITATLLLWLFGLIERVTLRRMGVRP